MKDNLNQKNMFDMQISKKIIASYMSYNSMQISELSSAIENMYSKVSQLHTTHPPSFEINAHASSRQILDSLSEDWIVSFINGKKYKTLKRHLSLHGLTPELYRTRFGLPADYPMVAPGYAIVRAQIARGILHGRETA